MSYRRALLLVELGSAAPPALSALRLVAPGIERLVVVACLPAPRDEVPAALEALRQAAAKAAPSLEVQLVPALGTRALQELTAAEGTELLVVGTRSLCGASAISAVRLQQGLPVLLAEAQAPPGPLRELACIALGQRALISLGTFLRDHADPSMHVALLTLSAREPRDLTPQLEVAGITASVEEVPWPGATLREALEGGLPGRRPDLLVIARLPMTQLLDAPWPAPVLLLPPIASEQRFGQRDIDVADLLDDGGALRTRIDLVAMVGELAPVPDQEFAFVSGGRVVATVTTLDGEAALPVDPGVSSLGVYRVGERASAEPAAAVEQDLAVVRPGTRPLLLFDAGCQEALLRSLSQWQGPLAPELLAVRLRPARSCRSLRERLRGLALPPRILDARVVLDEGEALDVSEEADPVRLARVAAKLRGSGFPVAAILHRGPLQPHTQGFAALSEPELLKEPAEQLALAARVASESVRSEPLLLSPPIAGNRIELELDNAKARRWLLEAIRESRRTLHFQVYMALDDGTGASVEAALAEAGARGVRVRVLVDSLHGMHGSFGTRNPLLERLGRCPGVELRVSRPLNELPSLTDLKQRDHRKLVIVDGERALVGGRNLGHEYYTAFEEVALTERMPWREVPWLDAGARVEGPAVASLARAFLEAWTDAGGEAFDITTPPPAGSSAVRVIVHQGLRDARTLEAYLDLIDSARSHLYVVNGFPLVLELQHALLRALRRGVRVRVLIGHVMPTHGGQPFRGPWETVRTAGTELVHSRMDPLIAAGGEIHLFALRDLPGWAPGLGVVHPYVHAKVMSADGRRCAVGSANLDITASYWESELMLLVEDAALAGGYEARLDALMAGSPRVRRDDRAWQELAQRRAWMRHWPGILSV
ncbi:MAG: phosphatidylserine/phosphatidylglycerophosphate/cardiolipin synthase family protein [Myxococcaceae bacterium]|nr:phosphatidylserine/phosphatidylglycerophosphate/cardiolipin synthase family protein [Myxococcaceae bacterium]